MPAIDPYGLSGQVLDGQFRVDHWAGEGGFSVVYRGTHIGLGEPIAIKCLKLPHALGSAVVESFIKRFRDESRIHYRLSQGNLHIARSIASGTTVAPATSALIPYTVLEWLEGRSLAEDFDERRALGLHGRRLIDVVKMLDTAIEALAFAHAQGVVHRDVNPGNLFFAKTPSGVKLKVLDFGVAKIMADSALAMGSLSRTLGNMRIFTPAYGAPEQFDDRLGAIGAWTDVYAVALVVLEALMDRAVMEGDHIGDFAAMALNATRRPTPRALGIQTGDRVQEVMASAVALSSAERPRDAGELWGMLKNAIAEDEASGRAPHADHPLVSTAPSTLRMAEPLPKGKIAPIIEVARVDLPPDAQSAYAVGGTLRMSSPQRGEVSEAAGYARADARVVSPHSPENSPHHDAVVPRQGKFKSGRALVFLALFLAIVALAFLTARLLSTPARGLVFPPLLDESCRHG